MNHFLNGRNQSQIKNIRVDKIKIQPQIHLFDREVTIF
jgi:hypothetical protein